MLSLSWKPIKSISAQKCLEHPKGCSQEPAPGNQWGHGQLGKKAMAPPLRLHWEVVEAPEVLPPQPCRLVEEREPLFGGWEVLLQKATEGHKPGSRPGQRGDKVRQSPGPRHSSPKREKCWSSSADK